MRILWVATKPPVPSADGGRLVARVTIEALRGAGHAVTVVAPIAPAARATVADACARAGLRVELVPAAPAPWPRAALRAMRHGLPVTIARHAHPAMRAGVDALLAAERFDVVHAEQLHALAACAGAAAHGVPLVLRAQNVESDLWRGGGLVRRVEAERLARFEGAAVRDVAATVALTRPDAERLATLAGGVPTVHRVAAPFPAAGLAAGPALTGAPAVVLPGSAGWPPNDEAAEWFTAAVWPVVVARLPEARLHRFGEGAGRGADRTVTRHPAPEDSAALFPDNAIVVVPLRRSVGIRMLVLEAWARGVPVVATPAATAGLEPGAEHAVALAREPGEIAAAIARLAGDTASRQALVAAGRACVRTHHDPATVAAALAGIYENAVSAARARA